MTSVSEKTISEMIESLTGFDEIAIEKHMGIDPYTGGETKPMLLLRSLVFVDQRRAGKTDAEARQHAMEYSGGALNTYFIEDDEVTPEEPTTEPGKDD